MFFLVIKKSSSALSPSALRFLDCLYVALESVAFVLVEDNTLETVVFVLVEDTADYCAFFGDTNCFHRRDELIPFLFLIINFSGHFHWEQTRFHQPRGTPSCLLLRIKPIQCLPYPLRIKNSQVNLVRAHWFYHSLLSKLKQFHQLLSQHDKFK